MTSLSPAILAAIELHPPVFKFDTLVVHDIYNDWEVEVTYGLTASGSPEIRSVVPSYMLTSADFERLDEEVCARVDADLAEWVEGVSL